MMKQIVVPAKMKAMHQETVQRTWISAIGGCTRTKKKQMLQHSLKLWKNIKSLNAGNDLPVALVQQEGQANTCIGSQDSNQGNQDRIFLPESEKWSQLW